MTSNELLIKLKSDFKIFRKLAKKDLIKADVKASEIIKSIELLKKDPEVLSVVKTKQLLNESEDILNLFRNNVKQIIEMNKKYKKEDIKKK